MSLSEPFVIHEEQCEFEGQGEAAPGSVRWRTLISGDRTPTESLTVGVAELEPGESRPFRPHKHAQAEVCYVLSGKGTISRRSSGNPSTISASSSRNGSPLSPTAMERSNMPSN